MSRIFLALVGSLLLCGASLRADSRYTPTMDTNYHGTHPDLFAQQNDRVRLLVRQAQVEISSQLGLIQYQDGFYWPFSVRFDDTPARGVEHAIAYVMLVPSEHGGVAQQLVVNLDVWPSEGMDFDKVFYHEMTHAVLNDAIVTRTQKLLPSWVQEGLAVYIAGDGEWWVSRTAKMVHVSQIGYLIHDLRMERRSPDYAEDYLAFQLMKEKYSINALQAFVRELTEGKDPETAVEDSTGVSWDKFTKDLAEYQRRVYTPLALPG
jgi:hypothetical protein